MVNSETFLDIFFSRQSWEREVTIKTLIIFPKSCTEVEKINVTDLSKCSYIFRCKLLQKNRLRSKDLILKQIPRTPNLFLQKRYQFINARIIYTGGDSLLFILVFGQRSDFNKTSLPKVFQQICCSIRGICLCLLKKHILTV